LSGFGFGDIFKKSLKNAQIPPPLEFLISHFPVIDTFLVGRKKRKKRELSQGISNTMPTGDFKNVSCEFNSSAFLYNN